METINWEKVRQEGWNQKNKDYFTILSIDGGGMKGVFVTEFLSLIEKKIKKPISTYFDMISGTSSGAITGLALSIGLSAKEINNLYKEKGELIFALRNNLLKRPLLKGIGKVSIKSLYKNDDLYNVLLAQFGDSKLKDSKNILCIPSVEFYKAEPKNYTTPHLLEYKDDEDVLVAKVATASSSAPIFFPGAKIGENECKLDGGIYANNPIILAVSEALKLGVPLDKIRVLSIGTGQNIYDYPNDLAFKGGGLTWILKLDIFDFLLTAQTKATNDMAKNMLKENLVRVDFMSDKFLELDNVEKEQCIFLKEKARQKFEEMFCKEICKKFFSKTKITKNGGII